MFRKLAIEVPRYDRLYLIGALIYLLNPKFKRIQIFTSRVDGCLRLCEALSCKKIYIRSVEKVMGNRAQ